MDATELQLTTAADQAVIAQELVSCHRSLSLSNTACWDHCSALFSLLPNAIALSDLQIIQCTWAKTETPSLLQKIREYEHQYERSVQEARELALAARRQIAAELRGPETTPLGDFDDDYGERLQSTEQSQNSRKPLDLEKGVLVGLQTSSPRSLRRHAVGTPILATCGTLSCDTARFSLSQGRSEPLGSRCCRQEEQEEEATACVLRQLWHGL